MEDKPDYKMGEVFDETKREVDRRFSYDKYATGWPTNLIAEAVDCSVSRIRDLMMEIPGEYEKSKQAREKFMSIRVNRSLSLVDAEILRRCEDEEIMQAMENSDLLSFAEKLSKRHQLYEGGATERLEGNMVMTLTDIAAAMGMQKK
jgi:hypothetical protein